MRPLRVIATNTGWLMLDRLTRMALGVTVGAWMARHLGPERFGAIAYVLAFLALFQTFGSLGLDMILSRELARPEGKPHVYLGSSLVMRIAAGFAGWVIACGLMSMLRPGDGEALLLTGLAGTALLFQPTDLVDLWFQSQSQSRRAVIPRTTSFLLVSALRIVLIVQDAPLWTFAAAYFVEGSIALFFVAISYSKFKTPNRWHWDFTTAKLLLGESWLFLLSGMSIMLYVRVDQLLLRALAGDRELGIYAAILPFSQAWHFIPSTVCASTAPFLVKLLVDDPDRLQKRMVDLMSLLAWSALAISIAVSIAGYCILPILLGPRYDGARSVLAMHVFSIVPMFLGIAQLWYLTTTGRIRIVLLQTVAGLFFSVGLNLILIPHFGAMGSAISILCSQLVSSVLVNAVFAPDVFRLQMRAWTQKPTF